MNILRFKSSQADDVVEYRARISPQHIPFSYDDPYSIVLAGSDNVLAIPNNSFVYITAADEFNESDYLKLEFKMARIGKRTLRFNPSTSADTVGYRIYILPDGEEFGYEKQYHEIEDAKDGQRIAIDIGSLPNAPTVEGLYDTYITSIDARGNESAPLEIQDKHFDFVAPDAPTDGEIE